MNYVIAYKYGTEGRLSTYALGHEVFHSTPDDAKGMLRYVKSKSPDKDWKIFKIEDTEFDATTPFS
jgi:hypothetical protein